MKRLISTIIFIIISGCGFKIVNVSELNNFSIINISSSGDKRINYIIKNNILYGTKKNEENLDSIHKIKGTVTSLGIKSFTHQVIFIEN